VGSKSVYECQNCGYQSPKWLGRCPDCGSWNSFEETDVFSEKRESVIERKCAEAVFLNNVPGMDESRIITGISEFNRVLGGGIVPASVILVGGEPGIGKSTLLLQVANHLSQDKSVVYIAGEESPYQIKMRAKRLGIKGENLRILPEICLENILFYLEKEPPDIVIPDSIQTIFSDRLSSAPGTVSQIKECTQKIVSTAKKTGTWFFVVGHVTKEGVIAGPCILEHMVDTVVYFEGERKFNFRLLRTVKNRFGSTNEIGLFQMTSQGLKEVLNPSAFLLQSDELRPGVILSSSIEGTRPLLIEIECLTNYTHFGNPRRLAQGIELNRLFMIIAIMEKYLALKLSDFDIYVNVSGGVKISDPAIDLAVAMAIFSSLKNRAPNYVFAVGELSLSSDIKPIPFLKERIKEAVKLGYDKIIFPKTKEKFKKTPLSESVKNLGEAVELAF